MTASVPPESAREALLTILEEYVWKSHIDDQSKIYQDLRIAGDDAWELLERIRHDFGVDFTGMNFANYFPSEGEVQIERLERLFRFAPKRKPLTVGHLLQVIEVGRWWEP